MSSLKDYFTNLELSLAVISETWFHQGEKLDKLLLDAEQGMGLSMILKNRKKTGRANPGGGVGIVFDKQRVTLKEYPIKRGRFEIVAASGKIKNNSRPLYVIAVYLSTKLRASSYHACLSLVSDAILKIKNESSSPYIILAGDFNRKDIHEAIGDYVDISVAQAGPTREGAYLDLAATNMNEELTKTFPSMRHK